MSVDNTGKCFKGIGLGLLVKIRFTSLRSSSVNVFIDNEVEGPIKYFVFCLSLVLIAKFMRMASAGRGKARTKQAKKHEIAERVR